MEDEFQDQGQLDKYLEEQLSPRGSQSVHSFLSGEEKQQSIRIEDQYPEGEIMNNQAPKGGTSKMVVIKRS